MINNSNINQLNERMGFTDAVPSELVDKIWHEYLKTTFATRRPKYSTPFTVDTQQFEGFPERMTFVVEKGLDNDYYKAALFNDGSIHMNVDALSELSDEEAKSSVEHELVHVLQYEKERTGERKEGEYGYNKAVNQGLIDEKERRSSLWMMEQLQEKEIEARLSQLYKYIKNSMHGITPQGSITEYVKMIVGSLEEITKLSDLETVINRVQGICDGSYLYYINLFVKDAQAALYGANSGKKKLSLPEAKKMAAKLLGIYRNRFDRYRKRVYNAAYQAVQDAQQKSEP